MAYHIKKLLTDEEQEKFGVELQDLRKSRAGFVRLEIALKTWFSELPELRRMARQEVLGLL